MGFVAGYEPGEREIIATAMDVVFPKPTIRNSSTNSIIMSMNIYEILQSEPKAKRPKCSILWRIQREVETPGRNLEANHVGRS